MAFICYKDRNFQPASLRIINEAAAICADYARQGYDLTLRQLYYVFVSRDAIPNTERSYKNLGSIVNDARLAGLLDWDWLVDRGRSINRRARWDHPREIIEASGRQFHLDWWSDQPTYVEVWVEKQALAGVIERVSRQYDVTSLACKGYMSQSEQHAAGMRMLEQVRAGKRVHILHLGDHDPSGIDMTRDNEERLRGFIGHHLRDDYYLSPDFDDSEAWQEIDAIHQEETSDYDVALFTFERIALNMDQIRQYNPPPNPAKMTDSRATDYIAEHGRQSWELDALPPNVLYGLIEDKLGELIDFDLFEARQRREATYRERITELIALHGRVLDRDVAP